MNLYNYGSTMKRESNTNVAKVQKQRDIDFKKHVHYFVLGCLYEYFTNVGMRSDIGTPKFAFYLNDSVNIVIGYLEGTRKLDGSCSDFQCTTAHSAAAIWGWPDR